MKKTKKLVRVRSTAQAKKTAHPVQKRKTPIQSLAKRSLKQKIRQNQPLHRRIVLHPISVFGLLVVGVFMSSWTYGALTADTIVSVKIHAPPLTKGAVILAPADGGVATGSPVTVSGSCQTNSYINVLVNKLFSGTAPCAPDGTFQMQADVFVGTDIITAQDYNTTDDPGPGTPGIQLTYAPPVAPANASDGSSERHASANSNASSLTTNSGDTTLAPPLVVATDFQYQTFTAQREFSWTLAVKGGTSPYVVDTEWGDGQHNKVAVATEAPLTIKHAYAVLGYYVIRVQTTDARQQKRTVQLAAYITKPGANSNIIPTVRGSGSNTTAPPSFAGSITAANHMLLWAAWPPFAIVSLMAICFWLGERQEYQQLVTRLVHSRPKPAHYRR